MKHELRDEGSAPEMSRKACNEASAPEMDRKARNEGSASGMKRMALNAAVFIVGVLCIAMAGYGFVTRSSDSKAAFNDNQAIDQSNVLVLDDSKTRVSFSDVVLSPQGETRELIVSTQTATESVLLEDRVIQQLDIDILKKHQTVSYTTTGYFVVNLESITEDDIIVDDEKKNVTIKIEHARLKDIVIDPEQVMFGDVQESFFNRGAMSMTVEDYNQIEQELKSKLETAFNSGDNLQKADDNALKMVKEVYEPVIKAVDHRYELTIVFGS